MKFDLVAEKLFQRMVSGHRDLVAARALGRQDGFIGTTQQIRAVIAPWQAAATPMLTVRVMVCPSIVRRSRTIPRSRSANDSAAWIDIG
jgi:hypothetical protein